MVRSTVPNTCHASFRSRGSVAIISSNHVLVIWSVLSNTSRPVALMEPIRRSIGDDGSTSLALIGSQRLQLLLRPRELVQQAQIAFASLMLKRAVASMLVDA